MAKDQKELKELLRSVLPLLEDFIGEEAMEEKGAFGRSDEEVDMDFTDDGYSENVDLNEDEINEKADKMLDESIAEDDKEIRKRLSSAAISQKLGKDKKSK
jgi:hypothetical protein